MFRQSLIPLLIGTESAAAIEIASYSAGLDFGTPPRFLAATAEGQAPLTRLLGGRVRYAALDALKPVVMLLSRDDYPRIDTAGSILTNPDIDRLWREFFRAQRQNPALAVLALQVDAKGELIPFDPLFYCRPTKRFFAPSCPRCGQALTLCTDDTLLTGRGLQPYTNSLRRYLACSACGKEDVFFAYDPDDTEQGVAQGPDALIRGFGGLTAGDLPCIGCPEHAVCYGGEDKARQRIIPVAFYPFYLLIFEAAALSALDFLGLAAGMPFIERAQGLFTERELQAATPIPPAAPAPPHAGAVIITAIEPVQDEHAPEIARILGGIRARWELSAAPTASPEPPAREPAATVPGPEVFQETVMLAPDVRGAQAEPPGVMEQLVPPPMPPGEDDFRTETVIMHHLPRESTPVPPPAEDLTQTVLMRPEQEPPALVRETAPAPDLEATVIMSAQTSPKATQSPPAPPVPDALTETVMMGAAPPKPTPPPQPPAPAIDDDALAETVILKPKK